MLKKMANVSILTRKVLKNHFCKFAEKMIGEINDKEQPKPFFRLKGFLNGPTPASFCLCSFFSNTNFKGFSGIRTRTVGIEV